MIMSPTKKPVQNIISQHRFFQKRWRVNFRGGEEVAKMTNLEAWI
jgi:hypothetical protein